MVAALGLRPRRSGLLLLLLLLVTPVLLVTAQPVLPGPLASSGTPAATLLGDPATAAQPSASILEHDTSDTSMMAVDSPVPNSRVKAQRMAAAMAAVERRNAASQPLAPGAATAAAAAAASDAFGIDTSQAGSTYQPIVDRHNSYRARHQAAALAWSSTLGSQAASYAAQCNFAHDPYANAGENLFATSDTSNPAGALMQAIDLWYNEVQSYNFNNPGFSSATGHFTQVVWRGSSTIGCAVQVCSTGLGGTGWGQGTLVVCRYSPAGNVLGYFQTNVLPASANPPPVTPPPVTPPPVTPSPPPSRPPTSPPPASPPAWNPPPASPPPANPPPTIPIPPATLPSGFKFASPGCLYSVSQSSRMCMEDSGYAVLYANGIPGTAVWVSSNTMTSWFKPYKLSLGQDGNLAVLDTLNRVLWQSNTERKGTAPYRMVVQDDGVAVLFDANNARIWATK